MLKVFLAFLIAMQILIFLLMIFCLSGFSILLPGLGLIVAGEMVIVLLLVVEIVLSSLTFTLYRHLRRDSGKLA